MFRTLSEGGYFQHLENFYNPLTSNIVS